MFRSIGRSQLRTKAMCWRGYAYGCRRSEPAWCWLAPSSTGFRVERNIVFPSRKNLRPDRVGVGVIEAWRGELIHLVFIDGEGGISRYAIKDPSFNNWTGLAIAARGQLVADFPLCNKSFGLSYSGNDL